MLHAVSKALVRHQQKLLSLCLSTTASYCLLNRVDTGVHDAIVTSIRVISEPSQHSCIARLLQCNLWQKDGERGWVVTAGGSLQLMSDNDDDDDDADDERAAGVVSLEGQEDSEEEDVSAASSSDTGSDDGDEFGEPMHASGSM